MIIFYYKKMILGGAELLIIRLAKAMKKMNMDICVLSENIDDDLITQLQQNDLEYLISVNSEKELLKFKQKKREIHVITLFYVDYIRLRYLTKEYYNIHVKLYCVHSKGMIFGRPIPFPMKKYFLNISRIFIEQGINKGSIFFMDQETIDRTKSYYLINDSFEINDIGLPYDFIKNQNAIRNQINKKIKNNNFNIISIARADFPFKGYVIGLINFFSLFNERYPDSNLHIIASGKDEHKILEEIKKQNSNIRKHINFYGKTNPSEMKEILSEMDVLVGMGTTLLDASSEGVLAIPVVPGTLKCLCADTFFYENFLFSVLPEYGKENLIDQLEKVEKMNEEEYFDKSEKSYSKVKDKFSIVKIAKCLSNSNFQQNDKYLSFLNICVLLDRIWKKIKR